MSGSLEHSGAPERRVLTDTPTVAWDVSTPDQAKASVPDDAITLAKLQNIVTARLLGRVTAATGDPEELTGTQATTLLDVFTSALKGAVPASGGGTTNFMRADGTWAAPPGGGGGGPWTVVKKTADESISNNTLQDDDHLFFTMAANTTYFIRLRVFFSTAATPDFKYRVTNVGATITLIRRWTDRVVGGGTARTAVAVLTTFDAADVAILGAGADGIIFESIIIQVGAVGGTFKFQWAQNTTNATPAIVRAGSHLEYWSNP